MICNAAAIKPTLRRLHMAGSPMSDDCWGLCKDLLNESVRKGLRVTFSSCDLCDEVDSDHDEVTDTEISRLCG